MSLAAAHPFVPGRPVPLGFLTGLGVVGLQFLEDGPCLFHDGAHGLGIDAADMSRIGTPFFRTDLSRALRTGGVGLWLALARRIVDAHGGALVLERQSGVGTTVRITLPTAHG
ncbi:ATP-binding protein [Myxococcus xanthus]|uniref:ATP-binding protein n=1 Tax=Myxococcus xanthus TaxID=34 RepID=UPI0011635166|nr:ATP-binding protein [Myxococcus xanthus]QDE94586.1 hypothetical protein BHS05_01100 [Myxococcus xanthus]